MTSFKTWILQMYVHMYAECKNHYHVSLTVFLARNLAILFIASLLSNKKPHATNGVKSYKTFSWNEVWFLWFSNIILHRTSLCDFIWATRILYMRCFLEFYKYHDGEQHEVPGTNRKSYGVRLKYFKFCTMWLFIETRSYMCVPANLTRP